MAVLSSKYDIVVNDFKLNKVESFTIRRSIENFVDTFEISFGNVSNSTSPFIYLGDKIKFLRNGVDNIFEGIVETKETTSNDTDLRIRISGRDSIVDLVESRATFQSFKKTTDNAILEKVISQIGGYTTQFAEAQKIDDYDIGPGDTIAAVMDGVAKLNGFFIWRRGNTIIKDRIASSGAPVDIFNITGIQRYNNILQFSSSESIEAAKTKIEGFSNTGGRSKSNVKASNSVSIYQSNAYQLMLRDRNGHSGSSARLNRPHTMSVSGKNVAEAQKQVDLAAKQSYPKVRITILVKGFRDFELNDIIHIDHALEGINKDFVLTGITYTLDGNVRETTELVLQPLGSYPQ